MIVIKIVLSLVVVALLSYSITAFIYLETPLNFGKRFYHDVLDWHKPNKKIKSNNYESACKYCGKIIARDGRGDWEEVQ